MKRVFLLALCVVLVLACVPAGHATQERVIRTETTTQDGITVIDELCVNNSTRASDKTATRTRTYKNGSTVIAVVAIQVVFRYSENTVYVLSKSVIQSDTYDGWSYVQDYFISSGASAILSFHLTKQSITLPYTLSLTCDKNGNLS